MAIDWLTVTAQVVNFLILIWLLKRFLYQRIIDAMSRREGAIAEHLANARDLGDEAAREAQHYRDRTRELEAARERLLAEAEAEAEELRRRRRDALRAEIEATRRKWLEQVQRERETFLGALRKQAATRFLTLARQVLADLADADLEGQMVNLFIGRLGDVDPAEAEAIAAACRRSGEPILIASGFDLPADLKRRVTTAIHKRLGSDLAVDYHPSDDISCGIELIAGGRSLLWSLDGYLDSLEARLAGLIEENGAGALRTSHEATASYA